MGYRSLRECVDDLERHGQLVRIDSPVDARLEAAAIHRRVHAAGGPAIYFAQRDGLPLSDGEQPVRHDGPHAADVSRRARTRVERLVALRANPQAALRRPWRHWRAPLDALWPCCRSTSATVRCSPSRSTHQRPAAARELAARRRPVRHAAGRVHRRCPRTGPAALEPRHVSRAACRQSVQRRPRGRAALPNPPLASACTTRRRCRAGSRFASTCSSAGRRRWPSPLSCRCPRA